MVEVPPAEPTRQRWEVLRDEYRAQKEREAPFREMSDSQLKAILRANMTKHGYTAANLSHMVWEELFDVVCELQS